MDSIIKSDFFFFVTGMALIIITGVCLVALFYLIRIFKDLKTIVKTAKTEAQHLAQDIEYYRKDIKQGEKAIKNFVAKNPFEK